MLQDPEFLDEAPETGYRLCCVAEASTEPSRVRLARSVPWSPGSLALCGVNGVLRILPPPSASKASPPPLCYQVFLGAVPGPHHDEPGSGAPRPMPRPKAVRLPWTGLAFVPCDKPAAALFCLLGETDTIMYSTLGKETPGSKGPSSIFAYGSRMLPLERHRSRVRALGVDATGTTLASGDEDGHLRLWPLTTRGGDPSSFLKVGGLLTARPAPPPRWIQIQAHSGPILSLSHGQGIALEEGQVVTAGVDGTVRVWSWRLDDEAKGLTLRPIHALVTESCQVLALDALSGATVAGTDRGSLYLWATGSGRLQSVTMSGQSPVLCVGAALGGGLGSLHVSGDEEGVVRLYRRQDHEDDQQQPAGSGLGSWQLVAECPLDAPVVATIFHSTTTTQPAAARTQEDDEEELVVVSASGLLRRWRVRELPTRAEDTVVAETAGRVEEEDEEEEEARGGVEEAKQSGLPTQVLRQAVEEEEEEEEEARRTVPGPTLRPAATAPAAPQAAVRGGQADEEAAEGRAPEGAGQAGTTRGTAPPVEERRAGGIPARPPRRHLDEEEDEMEGPRSAGPPPPTPLPPPTPTRAPAPPPPIAPPPPPPLTAITTQAAEPRPPPTSTRRKGTASQLQRRAQEEREEEEEAALVVHEPCPIAAPALHSTALVVQQIEAAERARFQDVMRQQQGGVDPDTESVLEEAARAVNLDPRRPAYQGVAGLEQQLQEGRERRRQAAEPAVRKQVEARWLCRLHEQRPTAEDYYTPGLEDGSRASLRLRVAPSGVRGGEGGGGACLWERARALAREAGGMGLDSLQRQTRRTAYTHAL